MLQRFPSVPILLLALLTSVVGGVLATAFCPSSKSSSVKPPACHEMAQQSHHSVDTVETDTAATRIEQPLAGCSHCISHSNFPRTAFALRQAETTRSSSPVDEPEAVTNVLYEVLIPRAISAREHAPPSRSSPLYVQLNVFRI